MSYIDYQFYTNTFKGVSLDEGTFNSLVDRANDFIDIATNYRITNFEDLHLNIQLRVKKAVAAQVEHMHLNGGIEDMQTDDVFSVSIGSFSFSSNQTSKTISDMSKRYLLATGLLYRGVSTYG